MRFYSPELENKKKWLTIIKIKMSIMSTEDAIQAMELTDHDFYIFLDKETGRTNVVYRREDGDYAVIETKPLE